MILDKLVSDGKTVLTLIDQNIQSNRKLLITYFNQHNYNLYSENHLYKELLEQYFMVYPDGVGIHYALRFLGNNYNAKMINATDLNEIIFQRVNQCKTRAYLIGGNYYGRKCFAEITEKFCGYSNGYEDISNMGTLISKLKYLEPSVIFVGAGVPKQEELAYKLSLEIKAVIICVGNFFEFHFKETKRIPHILKNSGLEWVFRLVTEPKRLWKRYLFGIPKFIIRVIQLKYRSK